MPYAEKTTVSVEKSRVEIESTLRRYGADQFTYATDDTRGMAVIQFRTQDRHVRYVITMPQQNERRFLEHSRGNRTEAAAYREWEQACRQKWRALALAIKAKLEIVQSGISEWLRPQLAIAYEPGSMPQGLPALPAPE